MERVRCPFLWSANQHGVQAALISMYVFRISSSGAFNMCIYLHIYTYCIYVRIYEPLRLPLVPFYVYVHVISASESVSRTGAITESISNSFSFSRVKNSLKSWRSIYEYENLMNALRKNLTPICLEQQELVAYSSKFCLSALHLKILTVRIRIPTFAFRT